jgi:general secretion pathway protein E
VFELLHVTSEVRDLIAQNAPLVELYKGASRAGMRTLREAAVRKLAQGLTSFEEVMRMTSMQV